MLLHAPARIPATLEAAVQRVRAAARTAAERTVDSLGLAAMSAAGIMQRDALIGAQFELNRKLAIFALTFNETLDQRVSREVGLLEGATSSSGFTSWEALSLVDDREVEMQVLADRLALEIAHHCEWEIRELDGYLATVLHLDRPQPERNPLRAEVVGMALIKAVESVADRPETAKVLANEVGRALALVMRETYGAIVSDLSRAGIQPASLTVRQRLGSPARQAGAEQRPHPNDVGHPPTGRADGSTHAITGSGRLIQRLTAGMPRDDLSSGHAGLSGPTTGGGSLGQVDHAMMSVIRRLSRASDGWSDAELSAAPAGWGERLGADHDGAPMVAPNLIVAHREELRQAATTAIDQMVIDVIAGLFDQILSDPKVPPQIARQIARLQLPVLRAALGDSSFFSSRKHPVRRFVNRIASLGAAVDDFDGEEGQALLARVRELVQEIVEGDFEQVSLYTQKLAALEAHVLQQSQARLRAEGSADQLLAKKEGLARVQRHFAVHLESALKGLPVPDFLRQFLGQVWSQAIAAVELEAGHDSPRTQRVREVGRALVMSVQPKGLPAQRAEFLRQLPQLMKEVNAGLDLIHCSEAVRRDFFAQLLPAHAESLKGHSLTTLEQNLLSREVDNALATPVPQPEELPHSASANDAVQTSLHASDFSPDEARVVGLVDESSVDWNVPIDIDLSAEPEIRSVDIDIEGLPPPEAVEPTRGKSLADHVQIGFAYQMHLEGGWHKVRLGHVSPQRTFFVFHHGAKQRKTVSMTYRMLVRLCDTGRMRAFENAYLLERATARARRQLAKLGSTH